MPSYTEYRIGFGLLCVLCFWLYYKLHGAESMRDWYKEQRDKAEDELSHTRVQLAKAKRRLAALGDTNE